MTLIAFFVIPSVVEESLTIDAANINFGLIFSGKYSRKIVRDISTSLDMTKKKAYARAGVDVGPANRLKCSIPRLVRAKLWAASVEIGASGFSLLPGKILDIENRSYKDRSSSEGVTPFRR